MAVPAVSPRLGAVRAALCVLLCDVFAEQTDFQLRPERLRDALERLDQAAHAGGGDLTLVATLHGLTITSPELALTKGLTIAQPQALRRAARRHSWRRATITASISWWSLSAGDEEPARAVARGREVLTDLLRALRLFGDGRVDARGARLLACGRRGAGVPWRWEREAVPTACSS